jgi:hypothetical protein
MFFVFFLKKKSSSIPSSLTKPGEKAVCEQANSIVLLLKTQFKFGLKI